MMKTEQKLLNRSTVLLIVLLTTSNTTLARSTPVTVQNDASNPVPVKQLSSERRFVGVSTEKMHGNAGIHYLTDICNSEFPGSTMCTTTEFANSSVDQDSGGFGWIRPDLVPLPLTIDGKLVFVDKTSGISNLDSAPFNGNADGLTCNGWNGGDNSSGLLANRRGEFFVNTCGTLRSVMCCSAQ